MCGRALAYRDPVCHATCARVPHRFDYSHARTNWNPVCHSHVRPWAIPLLFTVGKGPLVSKNIPAVAEVTQGEVVRFASAACKVSLTCNDGKQKR